jgi:hypothetical protein
VIRVQKGRWSHIFALNVNAPTEEKSDHSKDSFYEESEHVFDHFRKYHMKILLGDLNTNLGRQDNSNRQLRTRIYIWIVMIMVLRVVNFAKLENMIFKTTNFAHRNIFNTPGPLRIAVITIRSITY